MEPPKHVSLAIGRNKILAPIAYVEQLSRERPCFPLSVHHWITALLPRHANGPNRMASPQTLEQPQLPNATTHKMGGATCGFAGHPT